MRFFFDFLVFLTKTNDRDNKSDNKDNSREDCKNSLTYLLRWVREIILYGKKENAGQTPGAKRINLFEERNHPNGLDKLMCQETC